MRAVIIGAGASGISCAIRLKQNNNDCEVIVLEHLDAPCKKIFATGNGRCNITNKNADGFEAVRAFLESTGLVLRYDSSGRAYPYSNQAGTVVDAFMQCCRKYDIKIITDCKVYRTEKIGNTFNIFSDKGIFNADALVLATGGKSQSALGSDGSGYEIAKAFCHTVTPLSPALVQLKSSTKNCRTLKGMRTKCSVSIEINAQKAAEEYGEVLFTDYGLSGIVTMDLSKYISDRRIEEKTDRCTAVLDFIPEMSEEQLLAHIEKFGTLAGILPSKLCAILNKQAEGDSRKAVKYAKNWRVIITGTKGYSFAQITNGGVSNSELTAANESTLCSSLYIIGELTDNQFSCGGFNLNYAILSAVRAADDMSKKKYDTD